MLEKLAKWYLIKCMKGIENIELAINNTSWTYRKRNKEKEESISKTISKIKYTDNHNHGGIHTVPPSQEPAPKAPCKQY